jgi:hypothetical protein
LPPKADIRKRGGIQAKVHLVDPADRGLVVPLQQ